MSAHEEIKSILPKLEGWCTVAKAHRIIDCILELKPEHSFEIGVYGGRALMAMALAHRQLGRGVAHGIDPWRVQETQEGEQDNKNADWWAKLDFPFVYKKFMMEALQQGNLLEFMYWYRLSSKDAVKLFPNGHFGFIHQDGNHTEEVSLWEVCNWTKKLANGGYWLMDDTNWKTTRAAQLALVSDMGFKEVYDEGSWKLFQRNS